MSMEFTRDTAHLSNRQLTSFWLKATGSILGLCGAITAVSYSAIKLVTYPQEVAYAQDVIRTPLLGSVCVTKKFNPDQTGNDILTVGSGLRSDSLEKVRLQAVAQIDQSGPAAGKVIEFCSMPRLHGDEPSNQTYQVNFDMFTPQAAVDAPKVSEADFIIAMAQDGQPA